MLLLTRVGALVRRGSNVPVQVRRRDEILDAVCQGRSRQVARLTREECVEERRIRRLLPLHEKRNGGFGDFSRKHADAKCGFDSSGHDLSRKSDTGRKRLEDNPWMTPFLANEVVFDAVDDVDGRHDADATHDCLIDRPQRVSRDRVRDTTEAGIGRRHDIPNAEPRKLLLEVLQECLPALNLVEFLLPQCLKPFGLGTFFLPEIIVLIRAPIPSRDTEKLFR